MQVQQHKTVCHIRREIMDHKQNPKQEEDEEGINRLLLGIMEGYSDSVIPPLSQLCPLHEGTDIEEENNQKGCSSSSRKRVRLKNEAKDQVLQKERDRRENMTENYALLQSMLPANLFPKATREKIVSGTIDYIKVLKKEVRKLEELKNSSPEPTMESWKMTTCTNLNTSINLNVSGNVAFFGIQSFARRGLVTEIFMVFQKHKAEVLAANVAVNNGQLTLTVTATMNGNKDYTVEKIKRDIMAL